MFEAPLFRYFDYTRNNDAGKLRSIIAELVSANFF
jgi:hypothetical protein